MRLAVADPPYWGQGAKRYGHQHPEAHVWDDPQAHLDLLAHLEADYDGWVMALATPGLRLLLPHTKPGVRAGVWVKANPGGRRPNVRTGYAHEFTLFRPGRRGGQAHMSRTDALLLASPTTQRGVVGAKPARWTWWALDCLGYEAGDTVDDLFPGSGAVSRAVKEYAPGCLRCGAVIARKRRADARWCSAGCRQAGYRRRSA